MEKEEMKSLVEAATTSKEKMEPCSVYLGFISKHFEKDPLCILQLGIAILLDKPICLIVVDGGQKVPKTLEKIALRIEHVRADHLEDMEQATKNIMTAVHDLELEKAE